MSSDFELLSCQKSNSSSASSFDMMEDLVAAQDARLLHKLPRRSSSCNSGSSTVSTKPDHTSLITLASRGGTQSGGRQQLPLSLLRTRTSEEARSAVKPLPHQWPSHSSAAAVPPLYDVKKAVTVQPKRTVVPAATCLPASVGESSSNSSVTHSAKLLGNSAAPEPSELPAEHAGRLVGVELSLPQHPSAEKVNILTAEPERDMHRATDGFFDIDLLYASSDDDNKAVAVNNTEVSLGQSEIRTGQQEEDRANPAAAHGGESKRPSTAAAAASTVVISSQRRRDKAERWLAELTATLPDLTPTRLLSISILLLLPVNLICIDLFILHWIQCCIAVQHGSDANSAVATAASSQESALPSGQLHASPLCIVSSLRTHEQKSDDVRDRNSRPCESDTYLVYGISSALRMGGKDNGTIAAAQPSTPSGLADHQHRHEDGKPFIPVICSFIIWTFIPNGLLYRAHQKLYTTSHPAAEVASSQEAAAWRQTYVYLQLLCPDVERAEHYIKYIWAWMTVRVILPSLAVLHRWTETGLGSGEAEVQESF